MPNSKIVLLNSSYSVAAFGQTAIVQRYTIKYKMLSSSCYSGTIALLLGVILTILYFLLLTRNLDDIRVYFRYVIGPNFFHMHLVLLKAVAFF
jgi:hypothetical protein